MSTVLARLIEHDDAAADAEWVLLAVRLPLKRGENQLYLNESGSPTLGTDLCELALLELVCPFRFDRKGQIPSTGTGF